MYQIKKNLLRTVLFAAVSLFSMIVTSHVDAKDGVIATFNPPLVSDRHEDSRSSWQKRNQSSRPAREVPRADQGYYYWNEKYFAGRPNFYNRPYYYYYYDPRYYYDDTNGNVRYYPNY